MILADWAARLPRYESGSRWPQEENPVKRGLALGTRAAPSDGALLWWEETLMLLTGSLCNWAEKGDVGSNLASVIYSEFGAKSSRK